MIIVINQNHTAMFNISNFESISAIHQDNQPEDEYTLVVNQVCILGVYKTYMIQPLIEWFGDNISNHKNEENIVFTMPTQNAFPSEKEINTNEQQDS